MKVILVDAINGIVIKDKGYDSAMFNLLEEYRNKKIVLTGADDLIIKEQGLDKLPYEIFTLKHDPEKSDPEYFKKMLSHFKLKAEEVIYFEHNMDAVKSAKSLGINTHFFDPERRNLLELKKFLDENLG